MRYSASDGAEENLGPSKSALKREMIALQKLGGELVALSRDQLKKIDMPERLREAIHDAQRFTQHEAHRRQLQYIGKLMRDVDAAPLQAALDEINGVSAAAVLRLQQLERLRSQLMEDEAVCSEIARDYPGADIQLLRQLRRNAIKEMQQNKPPRAYRELFRVLREMQRHSAHEAALDAATEDDLADEDQRGSEGFPED